MSTKNESLELLTSTSELDREIEKAKEEIKRKEKQLKEEKEALREAIQAKALELIHEKDPSYYEELMTFALEALKTEKSKADEIERRAKERRKTAARKAAATRKARKQSQQDCNNELTQEGFDEQYHQ